MPDKWAQYAQPVSTPPARHVVQPAAVQAKPGDKWARYATAPASTPASLPATQPKASAVPAATPAEAPSLLPTAISKIFGAHPLQDMSNVVGAHLKNLVAAPYHAVMDPVQVGDGAAGKFARGMQKVAPLSIAAYRMLAAPTINAGQEAVRQAHAGNYMAKSTYDAQGNYKPDMANSIMDAIPVAGPWARSVENDAQKHGAVAAMLGLATDMAGGKALEAAGGAVAGGVHNPIRGALTKGIDETLPGTDITPRQRYQAAKRVGVDLPPAQATGSKILKPLDYINREGLLSAGMHEKLQGRNVGAMTSTAQGMLDSFSKLEPQAGGEAVARDLRKPFNKVQDDMDDFLGRQSPLDPEAGGAKLQGIARDDMAALHKSTKEGYEDFADQHGQTPVANAGTVSDEAQRILDKNARFSAQSPTMSSKKVMGIVQDASNLGSPEQVKAIGAPTVGDLIRNRSALMDMTRDPEIVKSSYMADLERLTKAHDDAITESLPEEGQAQWRGLNADWSKMKGTYDDPQSPFYNAVRTPNPSTLTTGIGGTSPEALGRLRDLTGDEGAGIVGRGVAEKMASRTPDGLYDLNRFGRELQKMPDGQRQGLWGQAGSDELKAISSDYQTNQPFEKAAYTADPETLTKGIGPKTAQGVRNLRDVALPDGVEGPTAQRLGPDAFGAMQRGVATDLLGTTADGTFNFNTLAGKLNKANEGYRQELFGAHNQTLSDLGSTARVLDTDYNRSGSGKLGQKIVEAGKFATGVPLLQYPLGKLLTSPAVSDWLMKAPPAAASGGAGAVLPLLNPLVGSGANAYPATPGLKDMFPQEGMRNVTVPAANGRKVQPAYLPVYR